MPARRRHQVRPVERFSATHELRDIAIKAHDCTSPFRAKLRNCPVQGRRLFSEEPLRNSFVVPSPRKQRNTIMDREHVKGAADKAKGAIKEGAGKLSGDKDMETEGKIDKAKGSAHNTAGDVKDAARDAADAIKK
jgi:uncharacterized protein YjbJ (UPF0337 family)